MSSKSKSSDPVELQAAQFQSGVIRACVYLSAFLIPPVMLGLVLAFVSMSGIMMRDEPEPVVNTPASAPVSAPVSATVSTGAPKRYEAVYLLSNAGVETLDTLGTYEILAESGLFDIKTAALEKKLVPTTGGIAIEPDLALASVQGADLLVVPAMVDPKNEKLISWLTANAAKFQMFLFCGEAARMAAKTPLLVNRSATSHFLALAELVKAEPGVHWLAGPRYVWDSNVITTAGMAASVDASFHVIEALGSRARAEKTAEQLQIDWNRETEESSRVASPLESLEKRDLFRIFLHSGYDWFKQDIDLLVFPGASELSIAAVLDSYPRSHDVRVNTVSSPRTTMVSRHGLKLVATYEPASAPRPDLVVIPSGLGADRTPPSYDPSKDEPVHRWITDQGLTVKSAIFDAPGKALPLAIGTLAHMQGADTARFVAKMIGASKDFVPDARDPRALPLWLLPILVGAFFVILAWLVDVKLQKRNEKTHRPSSHDPHSN